MEFSMQADGDIPEGAERQPGAVPAPLRTWAGHGTGVVCNGCGCSIQAHEIEYEIEMPPDSNDAALHFHLVCYRSWTGRGVR